VLNPGDESRVGVKFESWVMHFAHVIQSRNVKTWGVVIALALLLILIVAVSLQSHGSSQPFEMDDLYGLLD
jgi:uncharacterized integral membrane protein